MTATLAYPIDWVHDDLGYGRLHRGHGLERSLLLADLIAHGGSGLGLRDNYQMVVREQFLTIIPRVKCCSQHAPWPCEEEGSWHRHWAPIQPSADPNTHYTETFWEFVPAGAVAAED